MSLTFLQTIASAAPNGLLPEPTNYVALGWLFVGLAAMATAINQVFKLVDRFKDKPSGGEVRAEAVDKFVTKPEFNAHVARNLQEHDHFFKKVSGVERGLSREMQEMERRLNTIAEERTVKLHDRLNEILGDMREMRGEMTRKA